MTDEVAQPRQQIDRLSGRTSGWLVVAVTLLGATLRAVSLNTRSMWLDETTAIRQASWSIPEMLAWMSNNVHPPLFHTLLHYWILIVGRDEVAVRAYALLWGVAAIPLTYWAASVLYDRRIGLYSALIVALSPFFIWYSQEARMYTMMLVFSLLNLTALWKALDTGRRRWWVLYAMSAAAGIMSQYFFVFLLAGEAYFLLRRFSSAYRDHVAAHPLPPKGGAAIETALRALPELRAWIVASGAALLPLLWWLPQVAAHPDLLRGAAGAFNYGGTPPEIGLHFNELILVPVEAVFGFHAELVMRNLVSMWPLLITLVFLSTGLARRLTGPSAYLAYCGVGGALTIIVLGMWQPIILEVRYFTAVAAPLTIILARFLSELPARAFKMAVASLIVIAAVAWANQSYNPDSIVKWDNREAMAVINEGFQPGDTVLLVPNFVSSIPEYYLEPEVYSSLRKVPLYDVRGVPRNSPEQLAQDLERQVGPSHRVWLIATWQETPRIAFDRALTARWLRSQGFRSAQDHQLRKIRVTLFDTDPNREFFLDPEDAR